jgi:large repetitive protein
MSKRKLERFLNRVLVSSAAMGLMASTAIAAFASGNFQKTGSMNVARVGHTATLLSNGQVLVAGGDNSALGGGYLSSAELYNPSTGSWTITGSMTTARQSHQAVLLSKGQVLVAGGNNASGTLASAELYNPATGTWTATGSMITARYGFSLTLLPNSEVLAVQGTSAELYNPATGTWTATGSPTSSVGGPNAALLLNGQVLAIGESINTPSELYDPSTGTWSATGSTGTTMPNPITPRLLSGDVFATGSFASGAASYSTAALYDPSTGQFTLENGPCSCRGFNGALLQTGKVLVAGGFITVHKLPYNITESITSAELWDPSTQAWTSTGNLNISRGAESLTILANGKVLVAGGATFDKHTSQLVTTATAELYTP